MTPRCEHATTPMLGAYADGELAGAERAWWDRHLHDCAECTAEVRRIRTLGATLRQQLPTAEPSAALRAAVRTAVRTAAPAEPPRIAAGPPPARRGWLAGWPAALAALLVLGVGFGLGRLTGARDGGAAGVIDQVVAAHVRSLQVDHLVDVASSEHHVVKPWFAGKLDFSPPVPDLAAQGFPLLGARTEYLNGRAAAGLVYQRGPHRINVFVWPAGGTAAGTCRQEAPRIEQGFNLVRGEVAGMRVWAVSDLNAGELRTFAAAWLGAAAGGEGSCRGR
ncbi:MAG TPA: zf-HC2 domain-containing protein [Gemmatimonadales bacterium]|nr:zf-HC2 domain-containing protein [Gemmatimonadales bacterium]